LNRYVKNAAVIGAVIAVVICLFVVFVSVDLFPKVRIFNNTGEVLSIVSVNRPADRVVIGRMKGATVYYHSVISSGIDHEGGKWKYNPPLFFPHNFAYSGGAFYLFMVVNAQINSDGTIVIADKNSSFPLQRVAEQPDGFPLRPIVD